MKETIEWESNKLNNYFIKHFEEINLHYYNNKPKTVQYNRLRIVDSALKDLYYKCAINSWHKKTFYNFLKKLINSDIEENDTYNYDFCLDPVEYSYLYKKTQRNEAINIFQTFNLLQ